MNEMSRSNGFSTKTLLQYIFKYGVYFIFILMFIVFAFSNENFLSGKNVLLILQQAAPLMLGVIGMTFVMITAGIDISVGQNMYLSAVVVGITLKGLAGTGIMDSVWGYLLVALIAMGVGGIIGLINGIVISRFKIVPFITTLATMSIAKGLGLFLTQSELIFIDQLGLKLNDKMLLGIPVVIIVAVVLLVIFEYVLRFTVYGRNIMAIGNDSKAAQNIGINVYKNVTAAYIICGVLSGLGGVLSAGQIGAVASNFAMGNEFIIIPAAVLGGTSLFGGKGSIFPGAVIGIILVTTIVNGLTMVNADPYIYTIVRGVIIFLAVMVDSVNYKGELR